jgi:hypothetical protein
LNIIGLIKDIRTADKQIKDLKGTVDMAYRNRDKFQHISDSELMSRKQFVEEMSTEISGIYLFHCPSSSRLDIRNAMDAAAVRRKIEDDEYKRTAQDENLGAVTGIEKGNTSFVRGQQQVTREIISQQDEQLDSLGNAVDRLGNMGRSINDELKTQNRMLGELDRDIDDAGEKMNFVMAKLSTLLKTKDSCQIWTIVILSVILIVLGMTFFVLDVEFP